MIHSEQCNTMEKLNNFIVNNSITRSQIISISISYEKGNPEWGGWYTLFYFIPSIIGDNE